MNRRLLALSTLTGLLAACGTTMAQEPWPNLNAAEASLRDSLQELNRAPNRFGGHKAEAERLIRAALAEIEMAKRSYR